MKMKTKALLAAGLTLAASGLVSTTAIADVVLQTGFTGVVTSTSTNTATSVAWDVVDGVDTPASSLTLVGNDEYNASAPALVFQSSSTNLLNVKYNLGNEGSVTTIIEDLALSAGTQSIDLTDFSVWFDATTAAGVSQGTNTQTLKLTVEVVGSVSGSLGTSPTVSKTDVGGASGVTATADLSALADLTQGETYDVIINFDGGSSGWNIRVDDFQLNGDITVPEPGSLALMSIGGLLMIKRRRRG